MEGGKYTQRVGSRRQVMQGSALKTSGGLQKKDLMLNKRGRIVSRRKSAAAKRSKIVNRIADRSWTKDTYQRKGMRGGAVEGGSIEGGALEVPLEAGAQCGMRRY